MASKPVVVNTLALGVNLLPGAEPPAPAQPPAPEELRDTRVPAASTVVPPLPRTEQLIGRSRDVRLLVLIPVLIAGLHVGGHFRQQPSVILLLVLGVLLVPGALTMKALRLAPAEPAAAVVYAAAASVACLSAVILAASVLTPWLAPHTRPLSTTPLLACLDVLLTGLCLTAFQRGARLRLVAPSRVPPSLALLLLPLLTAGGTQVIENGGSITLVAVALGLAGITLLGCAFRVSRGRVGGVPLVLFVIALSLMWSFSLRSKGLYGYDIQQEFATYRTVALNLRWVPLHGDPYTAMLSISALPVALSQLTGLSGVLIFKLLFPVLFALYPVGIYLLAKRRLGSLTALVGTCLMVFTGSFASQMPAVARQEVGLLLFIALVLVVFDSSLQRRPAQVFAFLLGAGMVVSHYSTTYVALAAFIVAQLITLALRARGRSDRRPPVLGVGLLLLLVTWCAIWTAGVTRSTANLTAFGADVRSQGLDVLPHSSGSLLTRWLSGNVVEQIAPKTYFTDAAAGYATDHPWLLPYTANTQTHFPAVAASAPTVKAWVPGLSTPRYLVTTTVRQIATIGSAIGVVLMLPLLWRRKVATDLGTVIIGCFAAGVLMRLSGSASFAYNPERLAMQVGALLVIPFGIAVYSLRDALQGQQAPSSGWNSRAFLLAAVLLLVVFADTSGLGARAQGGNPPANLSATGEDLERFHATDQDLAASRWLAAARSDDSIIYADRYGILTVEASEPRDVRGLFDDLTPATLDSRSLVFASTSNIITRRARGAVPDGSALSTYRFPTGFLNTYKATVFDTGWARIYR